MRLPEKYKSFITQKGISLENPGLQEMAFRRSDALCAIDILRDAGIPILGGDVYIQRGSDIVPAHDNWSIKKGEQPENGWLIAENYIKNYSNLDNLEPLFVLVPRLPLV